MYHIRRGLLKGITKLAPELSGKMLDFGCGRSPYKPLFQVDSYTGVDVETSGHSDSDKKADVLYDGTIMPFPDGTFDSFICSEVLEHVFDIDHALRDLHRVLSPSAMGIVTTPFAWPEHEQPYDFARYSRFGLKHVLEKNGFEILVEMKVCPGLQAICQLALVQFYGLFTPLPKILRMPLRGLACVTLNLLGLFASKYEGDPATGFFLCHVWLLKKKDLNSL
jgi:SAM-dependent methyltransferase